MSGFRIVCPYKYKYNKTHTFSWCERITQPTPVTSFQRPHRIGSCEGGIYDANSWMLTTSFAYITLSRGNFSLQYFKTLRSADSREGLSSQRWHLLLAPSPHSPAKTEVLYYSSFPNLTFDKHYYLLTRQPYNKRQFLFIFVATHSIHPCVADVSRQQYLLLIR